MTVANVYLVYSLRFPHRYPSDSKQHGVAVYYEFRHGSLTNSELPCYDYRAFSDSWMSEPSVLEEDVNFTVCLLLPAVLFFGIYLAPN